MRLTFEQIKAITVGALEIEQCNDGIHFYKCTESQRKFWMSVNDFLDRMSAGSTGVRLDFHTDSDNITFRLANGGKYELYIDGLLRYQYNLNDAEEITLRLNDPLGDELPKEKRVTLHFPSHGKGGILEYLELDDNSTVLPHTFDCKMLFIGDSITQGCGTKYDSLSFAYRVSDYFNADSVIQGLGGSGFREESVEKIPYDPDIILIAYGTNDFYCYKTYSEFQVHVSAFLDKIYELYSKKKVFVISPIWRFIDRERPIGTFQGCRKIVSDEAIKRSFIHIDGLSLVPPIPEFFQDGVLHPNDIGYSLYAENLIKQLRLYL